VSRHGRDGDWPSLPSVVKHRSNAPAPPEVEGVTAVATADERDRAVLRIVGAGLEAVVEERVAGDHWTVHCVRGGDGAFAAVPARIVRAMPRGAGMPSVFRADPDAGARAAEAARRLLEAAGYRGPANVQLFERDGELLVHDVNLRPPASVALAIRAGLDLPALGLAAALGRPWGRLPPAPQPGVRYVSLVDELRAMRGSARRGPSPSRWAVARDLVSACISRRHVLDPPPHDLFWVPQTLGAAARAQARPQLGRR
jgi:hypothetical protein